MADLTPDQRSAIAYLTGTMAQWGLSQPSLVDWLSEQIRDGWSVEKILLDVEARPEFKTAFPEIEQRRQEQLKGKLHLDPISPGEIVAYRTEARALMRSYGLAEGFWDSNEDFAQLIVNDVSVAELNQRLELTQRRVNHTAPEVRAAFGRFFLDPTAGDAALQMLFLDPEAALPVLEDMVATAEVAGAGARFGFDIGQGLATQAAAAGTEYAQAVSAFTALDATRGLYDETVTEDEDLTVETGVRAQLALGSGAAEQVRRRAEERTAAVSGSQEVMATREGVGGLGTAGGLR